MVSRRKTYEEGVTEKGKRLIRCLSNLQPPHTPEDEIAWEQAEPPFVPKMIWHCHTKDARSKKDLDLELLNRMKKSDPGSVIYLIQAWLTAQPPDTRNGWKDWLLMQIGDTNVPKIDHHTTSRQSEDSEEEEDYFRGQACPQTVPGAWPSDASEEYDDVEDERSEVGRTQPSMSSDPAPPGFAGQTNEGGRTRPSMSSDPTPPGFAGQTHEGGRSQPLRRGEPGLKRRLLRAKR
ncbi:MAG: hypothetical protein M1818_005680 [Claussenomyces sp. TS43310]|nr:MAG: hypothetical protein M1818_005680 [Claussenomyces sp. TS43310]